MTDSKIANMPTIEKTAKAMQDRGFKTEIVSDKAAALAKVKELIPSGGEVMVGSSQSLQQIGFIDYLNSNEHDWKNVNGEVWGENDEAKRNKLRRQAAAADYFLASPNAVTENGQLVFVDATGSRVTALPFAAGKVILVVGAQKITANVDDAMKRVREVVFPQEDVRAQGAYGIHSTFGKWLIIEREVAPERITVILVNEALGY